MALKTRRPTGLVPPPVVLLEGETGSGRSWTAAELSVSPRVGCTYWIELGDESTADQYGAIPNVRYEIVTPDSPHEMWDWHALYGACRDFRDETYRAAEAGEAPPVLVVDQVGAVWEMLGEWAENRARSSKKNKQLLAEDPNAEIDITSNYWNDSTSRWRKLMSLFLTAKGIVVLLSRGEEVTLFENGLPTKRKTWKVAGQKSLPASMPIWVRMTRDGNPRLIKLRSVQNGIRPGVDREERTGPGFSLEWLIFERYGWDPTAGGTRALVPMVAGEDAPESPLFLAFLAGLEDAPDQEALRRMWAAVGGAAEKGEITEAESAKVKQAILAVKEKIPAGQPTAPENGGPSQQQHKHMHALWRDVGLGGEGHRDDRLAQTSLIVGRDIDSSAQLTTAEAGRVIDRLSAQAKQKRETAGAGVSA